MANGNGNNINTDDAAAAATADAAATAAATATATTAAQQEQHLTGDGSGVGVGGACGDAKQPATAARVNDLVADLWLNGSNNRGDYTNIRATPQATASTTTTAATTSAATTSAAAAATATGATSTATASNPSCNTGTGVAFSSSTSSSSTFSFKHFLNSSGTVTAPSSTVTSLDGAGCGTSSSCTASGSSNTNATTSSLQTSTGARPKVPQSASVSHMQPDLNGSSSISASSKMKRSPRFSSFDSQASLAENAACASSSGGSSIRLRPDLRLEVERSVGAVVLDDDDDDDHVGLAQVRNSRLYDERVDDDIFPSAASNLHASASNSRYVPRSYSSYDMPPAASSPRRRQALRPNRLVLAATPKMNLDLPLDTSNVAGAASALPDFVQDHLSDAWCQEAHLTSPPNSPLGAAEAPSCSVGVGVGAVRGCGGGVVGPLLLPVAAAVAACGLPSAASLPAGGAGEATGSTGKMLPDFLSDGPILHSSQRLADVAIGLPSNSIDSPPQEEADGAELRHENERLQRELQDTRVELSAQTRRAHDFEQQLLALTDARRRDTLAASAQTQSNQRLRRQVAQLEAELFAMRDGCDQATTSSGAAGGAGATASVMTPGSSHSSSSITSRPSRTHQLSRDLLRAADNAEQNLRQLLAGVDNLRQMAANLEQPSAPAATPRSPNPDHYSDFN